MKSSKGALGGAGSGVEVINDIYADVESYVDNSTTSSKEINASKVSITSSNDAEIKAVIVSASIGAILSGGGNVSFSINGSLAKNKIHVNTLGYIKGVDSLTIGGSLEVKATDNATIESTSIAASLAVAIGAKGGFSVSGAGAVADNTVLGSTTAYIENTEITQSSAITVEAFNTSDIDATVGAGSGSVAASSGTGVGAALGAAKSVNRIGAYSITLDDTDVIEPVDVVKTVNTSAFIKNSGITSTGDLKVKATDNTTVDATVAALAVGVTVALKGGIIASGAGVTTENTINSSLASYIDNSDNTKSIIANNIYVESLNDANINVDAGAAALGIFLGGNGGAVAISVAQAINRIDSDILAYIANVEKIDAKDVNVKATGDSTITAKAIAASASVAFSKGVAGAISGAGAKAENWLLGETHAYIANTSLGTEMKALGNLNVIAEQTSVINANIASYTVAGAIGGIAVGLAIGGSVVGNYIGQEVSEEKEASEEVSAEDDKNTTIVTPLSVQSYLENVILESAGNLVVKSNAAMTIDADVDVGSMAVSTGGAIAGAGIILENHIIADIGSDIKFSTIKKVNDVTLISLSTSTIDATAKTKSIAASFTGGLAISIAATKVVNDTKITLNSELLDSSILDSKNIIIDALDTSSMTIKGFATSVAAGLGFSGAGVISDSLLKSTVSANAIDSDITASDIKIKASSASTQSVLSSALSGGLIAGGVVFADITSTTNTSLLIDDTDLIAGSVDLIAITTEDNYVNAVAGSGGVLAGSSAKANTTLENHTLVKITENSSINLIPAENPSGDQTQNDSMTEEMRPSGDGKLIIRSLHTLQFDAELTTVAGGALSGTGAKKVHRIDADVKVDIGDADTAVTDANRIMIDANSINIYAQNLAVTHKNGHTDGYAVGLTGIGGGDNQTYLEMPTVISIDNANLTTHGENENQGVFINTLNRFGILDKVSITAGGLGAATTAITIIRDYQRPENPKEDELDIFGLKSEVTIGQEVNILSRGDIQISSRTSGIAAAIAESDLVAVASETITKSGIILTPDNTVSISGKLTAFGNLNLSAGRDTNFSFDVYKLNALVDTFAGSLIPEEDPSAVVSLVQTNRIEINEGAELKTARQMNLHVEKDGTVGGNAQTNTVNWVSKAGGTSDLGGDFSHEAIGEVIIKGWLETGIHRNQSIVFKELDYDGFGELDTASEEFQENQQNGASILSPVKDYTATKDSQDNDIIRFSETSALKSSELYQQLVFAQEQLLKADDNKPSNTLEEEFYQFEIDRLTNLLEAKGLVEVVEAEVAGEADTILPIEAPIPIIEIKNIHAEAGRIDIRADLGKIDIQSSATIETPLDTSVEIINNTLAGMVINDITIPEQDGGLYYNNVLQGEKNTRKVGNYDY